MNKILFFLLFPILIFSQEIDSFYELVSYDIYKNKISTKDALVFDVRTTEEFNLGHIKGSINIDFYDEKLFVDFFQKINKTKPIYIYCRSGNRSKKSSEILKKIGFVKVYDLLGGYKNWIKNSN
ncbi:MAG: rhodanese-like domain-containing protein [Flavobacteriaceae bacterium]|jgi:rhodanese-related sulfurtransferase|nr:rhodanese-like domain-containing protein [Flavobacteriaceae bacterium]